MKKSWKVEDINQVHVELSNNCNAMCPLCARVSHGAVRRYERHQISISQFREWFDESFVSRVVHWVFCGSRGDPTMCNDLNDIIRYIKQVKADADIRINTNGGARNNAFWQELGTLFAATSNNRVLFGIDGLRDSNHLYRRGVNWDKLMENVATYIAAGGKAQWDFLVFEHNEHQIEEAKLLSTTMGFTSFEPKRTLGFDHGNEIPVYSRHGKFEYFIKGPKQVKYRSIVEIKPGHPASEVDNIEDYLDKEDHWESELMSRFANLSEDDFQNDSYIAEFKGKEVSCMSLGGETKWVDQTEIFVGPDGIVNPCCFVDTSMFVPTRGQLITEQMQYLARSHGLEKFNLNNNSLKEIMTHINLVYADSWSKPAGKHGIQTFCQAHCSKMSRIALLYVNKASRSDE